MPAHVSQNSAHHMNCPHPQAVHRWEFVDKWRNNNTNKILVLKSSKNKNICKLSK